MPRESMEKIFEKKVEGREGNKKETEAGERKIGKPPLEETPERGIMSKEKIAEIKAKEEKELAEARKKIGEMSENKGEKGEKKDEKKPEGLPEDFMKKYQETLIEIKKRGILEKLKSNEELTVSEKLIVKRFTDMKAAKDFSEKMGLTTKTVKGLEGTLKEMVEKKKEK